MAYTPQASHNIAVLPQHQRGVAPCVIFSVDFGSEWSYNSGTYKKNALWLARFRRLYLGLVKESLK